MNIRHPLHCCLAVGLATALAALPAVAQPQRGDTSGGASGGAGTSGGGGESGGPELQDQRRGPMEVIDLPEPEVSITVEGDHRVIRANGLPNHPTGEFPNNENPNAIRPQAHEYRVPLKPTVGDQLTSARPQFGIALNGVVFDAGTGEFWSADGQRRRPGGRAEAGDSGERPERGERGQRPERGEQSERGERPERGQRGPGNGGPGGGGGGGGAWNYDALAIGFLPLSLDDNHAHVQPTGKYHYHGVPTGLLESLSQHTHDDHAHAHADTMIQIGWAFDGFPIYGPLGYADPTDPTSDLVQLKPSYQLRSGTRPEPPQGPGGAYNGLFGNDWEYVEGVGDLDEANGRFGVTSEFPDGTYYYVVTETFPGIPRYWRGQPDPSLRAARGGASPRR